MKYARINWLAIPPNVRSYHYFSTAPVGIKLVDGKPVLIPVDEQAQPDYDPLTQRLAQTTTITPTAYTITYQAIDLTAAEIEARTQAQEEIVDGRLVNRLLREQVDTDVIPPDEIDDYAALFPLWRFNFHAYNISDIVQHEGLVWRCVQAHSSQSDWSPPVAISLWVRLAEPGNPEWGYPIAYGIGDIVTYNGVTYRCLQAHTSQAGWNPVAAPSLWAVQP